MPDREVGKAGQIRADFPMLSGASVFVTVTDPLGEIQVNNAQATHAGNGRYTYDLTATILSTQGIWDVYWLAPDSGNEVRQQFTVGPQRPAAMTLYRLREQVATRVFKIFRGTVTTVQSGNIIDDTLFGGQDDFIGQWVIPHAKHVDAGRPRLVTAYTNQTLNLSSPFTTDPEIGTDYLIFPLPPREIDQAIQTAISDLSDIARVPVRISGIEVDEDLRIALPAGLTHVTAVYDDEDSEEIPRANWRMVPGRSIAFETGTGREEGDLITVIGQRSMTPLLWDDSTLDLAPDAVIARAEEILHSTRAGGAATDPDERLRRQISARNVYEEARKRTAGRILPNATKVID